MASIAVGYALASVMAITLFRPGESVVSLWFANVAAVAVLIRHPAIPAHHGALAVLAGATVANLLSAHSLSLTLLYAVSNVVGVTAGAVLARRRRRWRPEAPSVTGFLEILVLCGGLAPALAAGLFAVFAEASLDRPFREAFWAWWSGDALGFALFMPVLLLASRKNVGALLHPGRMARLAGFALCGALVTIGALMWADFPFVLVLVPPMVAAGYCRPFELAVVVMTVGAVLLSAAVAGLVPALDGIEHVASYYQLSVAIAVVLPFLGGLLVEQIRRDGRRLAESEQRFRRAMQDSVIGVAMISLDGRIREANPAFAAMLGYQVEELQTKTSCQITHPDDLATGLDLIRRVRAGDARPYRFEKRYVSKDGAPLWARVAGSVVCDEETGAPLHFVSQIENIDSRKRSEAAVADAEMRWNVALASAGQGVWEVDLRKGGVTYSATWTDMLGYDEHELDGDPDRWRTLIHPDDVERVVNADNAHFEGRSPLFEAEFRMRRKDGSWVWILDRGMVIERDPAGNVVRAIGSLTDITARKQAEVRLALSAQMLAAEKERLRVTLKSIGDAVICTDASNRISFMNPTAERLLRIAGADALGARLAEIYAPVDEETGEALVPAEASASAFGKAEHNNRAVLLRADGSRCSIREVVSPIVTDKGEPGGLVIVFQDFTDARTLQRELAHAAAHDSLTGLANRSSFIPAMAALVEEARQGSAEHQFVYLDLDHFKTVNDTAGHAAGDALLKKVGETIRGNVRQGDLVARLGGDEFAIVYRHCPGVEATERAARLVAAVSALEFAWEGRSHSIGASAGLAPINAASGEVDAIIARADAGCYEAKASGRGRVSRLEGDGTNAPPLDIAV